ncbi:DUF2750 domain-containing protein [Krasilnikovia sp. MM14-A1004]|uniref:DUF2750 domain-containing protein n=1 Tax=Krasilnikovia sp. MM14-A1004 TaxID=3373541 RepID=UPI00399CA01E
MSLSRAHTSAFQREVPREGRVWTVRDDRGYPAPCDADGRRAMPFWSKPTRARRIVTQVPAYADLRITEIALADWLDHWLPALDRDGVLVGVNWSGPLATGFDLPPAEVAEWFAA